MMMAALDAGADDILIEDEEFEIYTPYAELHNVVSNLEKAEYNITKAEITYRPKNLVKADDVAEKLFKLIEMLEDLDDVQKIYTNLDISDSTLNRLANS